MEVVIVIKPDDWPDYSNVGHRIFGVFKSVLAAEAAVRKAIEKRVPDQPPSPHHAHPEGIAAHQSRRHPREVREVRLRVLRGRSTTGRRNRKLSVLCPDPGAGTLNRTQQSGPASL